MGDLNPRDLEMIGQAAFGGSWVSQLGMHLNVDRRRVSDWISGRRRIPEWVLPEAIELLNEREKELKNCIKMAKQLKEK